MKYPWLYVGAKVVCVDAAGFRGKNPLREGRTYTVSEIFDALGNFRGSLKSILAVRIAEHENPDAWITGAYAADRFRPVLPDTTRQVESMKREVERIVSGKIDA